MDWNKLEEELSARQPGMLEATGRYAVLVPLVERAGELCLLYEVRAAGMRRQPGEVCFPGGRIEGAETPEDCALRETWEELGVPAGDIRVLGQLDFVAHRANFITYPVLAQVDGGALDHLKLNPAEVGEVFCVPLSYLLDHPPQEYVCVIRPDPPENFPYDRIGVPRDYRWQRGRENVPVYFWENHAIWGLTGRITRHLTALLREKL